jgi:3-hydroxybutyryl-CoA dehydratase
MTELKKIFADFRVGDQAEFSEIISEDMIQSFAQFSRDFNPLHVDPEYAKETVFGGTIAHGMIAGMLFSRLIGMHLPGKHSLYLRQSLNFRLPIHPNTRVTVLGEVINKTESLNLITISTKVLDKQTKKMFVEGEAIIKILK